MTYYAKLHPWCIIRSLPNMRSLIIARFRRSDAEAHLQILKANTPNVPYSIIFDTTPETSDSIAKPGVN
ncbi:hypothetical protein [Coleofasciculus sp. FACHB-1120]|uniref:hypothetical protein n=1 Tax=Coleofasciculus sp. FACHB-1120 TaxID=2692783 RepID=UPI0016825B39|nr:hypothetical protein [Coleofasciculus sp. FACHB-1120]MBD2743225.1 hypothetical protein [Coleofasciculus sp. FACHB-1120]